MLRNRVGILMVIWAALKDRTLQAEFPGDAEYAQRVRYRLLPGMWQSTKRRCSNGESANLF